MRKKKALAGVWILGGTLHIKCVLGGIWQVYNKFLFSCQHHS